MDEFAHKPYALKIVLKVNIFVGCMEVRVGVGYTSHYGWCFSAHIIKRAAAGAGGVDDGIRAVSSLCGLYASCDKG